MPGVRPSPTLVAALVAAAGFAALLVWNLVSQAPTAPPGPTGPVFEESQVVQGLTVTFTLDPARAGESTYRVRLTGPGGVPVQDAQEVTLTLQYLEHASGAPVLRAQPASDGSYAVVANSIAVPGRWQVGVRVAGGTADGVTASFTALVGPRALPAPASPPLFPYRFEPRNFGLTTVVGLELAIGGAAVVLGALWFAGRRKQRHTGVALGSAGVAVGLYLAATSVLVPFSPAELYRNPTPGDPASIARGRTVYQTHCAVCHGTAGRGDGPAARDLNPRPADLAAGHVLSHTDEDLFHWITNGIDGTAMPAFKDRLSTGERWDAVNYLRTLTVATQ